MSKSTILQSILTICSLFQFLIRTFSSVTFPSQKRPLKHLYSKSQIRATRPSVAANKTCLFCLYSGIFDYSEHARDVCPTLSFAARTNICLIYSISQKIGVFESTFIIKYCRWRVSKTVEFPINWMHELLRLVHVLILRFTDAYKSI